MGEVQESVDKTIHALVVGRTSGIAVHHLHKRDHDGTSSAKLEFAHHSDVLPVSCLRYGRIAEAVIHTVSIQ